MFKIMVVVFFLLIASCSDDSDSSTPSRPSQDADMTSDTGSDAGNDMGQEDASGLLRCSECPQLRTGEVFTSCDGCQTACTSGFELCSDVCVEITYEDTNCGACMPQDCTSIDAPNGSATCNTEAVCEFSCDSGFVDLDGEQANGCECTDGEDTPGDGEDENCDGFDGDASTLIFVSNDNGDDEDDGTTPDSAVRTLEVALTNAAANGRSKIVLEATEIPYEGSVVLDGITMEIDGGYDVIEDIWVEGESSAILESSSSEEPVMSIQNLTADMQVSLVNLRLTTAAPQVPGAAAQTMHLEQIPNEASLIFDNVIVSGGAGGDGMDRARAADGSPGGNGQKGADAVFHMLNMPTNPGGAGGASTCGADGGDGGDATDCTFPSAVDGDDGRDGYGGFGTGAGGQGGGNVCGSLPSNSDGQTGMRGNDGTGGAKAAFPANLNGTFDSKLRWVPPTLDDADDGVHGEGGGGGGGGGSAGMNNTEIGTSFIGAGGSGGGAGGCGGAGGRAGQSGGASIAITVLSSTVDLDGVTVELGRGGDGGDGGDGGCGAIGGQPGALANGALAGPDPGPGAAGANGGAGGGGNGGPGGPTYGIVSRESTLIDESNIDFVPGERSAGGEAGVSGGSCGPEISPGVDGDDGQDGDLQESVELPL